MSNKKEVIDKVDELILVLADRQIKAIKLIGEDIYLNPKRVDEINAMAKLINARAFMEL